MSQSPSSVRARAACTSRSRCCAKASRHHARRRPSGCGAGRPTSTLTGLKDSLADPGAYFLGTRYEGVLLPDATEEYYGIPPSKQYVFDPARFRHATPGFAPLFSFARGGLAEAWTGGCYPFNIDELADFPFSHRISRLTTTRWRAGSASLAPTTIWPGSCRSTITCCRPSLDRHSEKLLRPYERARDRLNRRGAYLGRTRVATLSRALGSREACDYLGRCLWGCPRNALYTPSQTLRECQTYSDSSTSLASRWTVSPSVPATACVPSMFALWTAGPRRSLLSIVWRWRRERCRRPESFSTSVLRDTGHRVRLHGLMDNRQVLVAVREPGDDRRAVLRRDLSVPPAGHGHRVGDSARLCARADHDAEDRTAPPDNPAPAVRSRHVHVRIRAVHAALGLVNVNFRDTRREEITSSCPTKRRPSQDPL